MISEEEFLKLPPEEQRKVLEELDFMIWELEGLWH